MQIQLDHVAVYASDPERTAAFLAEALGLEDAYPGAWGGVPRILMAPGSRTGVAVFPASAPPAEGAPEAAGRIDHVAFRTTREGRGAFLARVRELGITHEEREFGICSSVFVRDPDGVLIEVTTYDDEPGDGGGCTSP